MTGFPERRYTEEQRTALGAAFLDGIRPSRRVVEMAARGELAHEGRAVAPFEANVDTVRHFARVLRKRRSAALRSELVALPPRDAVELLRRRLIEAAERELSGMERHDRERPEEGLPLERLRQIVRVVRELAALPGPGDVRPPAPGAKLDGQRVGGETRGGLAGQILASARRSTAPADSGAHVAEPQGLPVAPDALGEAVVGPVRALADRLGMDLKPMTHEEE